MNNTITTNPHGFNPNMFKIDLNQELDSIDGETYEDVKDIDLSVPVAYPTATLMQDKRGIFHLGDLHCIKAKRKAGKSMAVKVFASTFLKGEGFGLRRNVKVDNPKVLIFDTEQHISSVQKYKIDIHKICGWAIDHNNELLKVYPLNDRSDDERLKIIVAKVLQEKPNLVFIDGITDLMSTINDEGMANKTIHELQVLAMENNTAIVGIIHENKNDENARGWVGTILDNKSSCRLKVQKNNGIFIISQEDSREGEISNPISFTLRDGCIVDASSFISEQECKKNEQKTEQEIKEILGILNKIFKQKDTNILSAKEIADGISSAIGLSSKTGRRRFNAAKNVGILRMAEGSTLYTMDIDRRNWDLRQWDKTGP